MTFRVLTIIQTMIVFSDLQSDPAGVRVTTVQTTDVDIELQVRVSCFLGYQYTVRRRS